MIKKHLKNLVILHILSTFLLGELNIYTHRHYESDKILFKSFTNQTGIKINVIKGSADLTNTET
ncbi:MAG: hypothetical protein ACJZ1R_03085 [Candidatus Neomarinimicrobiota bacterium]